MKKNQLEEILIVGAVVRIGEKSAKLTGYQAGDEITLINGYFEYDNGLYSETQTSPSVWDGDDYNSIYHIFGNDLEDFLDSEVIN